MSRLQAESLKIEPDQEESLPQYMVFVVSDNGTAIPDSKHEKVQSVPGDGETKQSEADFIVGRMRPALGSSTACPSRGSAHSSRGAVALAPGAKSNRRHQSS